MAPARPDELREALARASERVLAYEDRLAAASASVLRKAGQIAAKRFQKVARPHLTAAGEAGWTPPHPDELVDVEAIVAGLRGKSDPIRQAAIANYGRELARLFPDVDWSVTNPLVGNVLSGAAQHVGDIADTTRINLMRILTASYDQGLSIEDTAKAIRQGMEAASTVRGRLIARTELAAVTNGGSLAATQLVAGATDTPYYKRWMTAPGAHYPRHEDYEGLDGQTVPLEQAFDVGGVALQFPGDPDGPPEEVCNCRCSLAYVTSPDEQVGGESLYAPENGDVLSEPLSTEADMPASAVGAKEGEDEEALSIVIGGDGIATQAALRTGDIPDWMPADLKVVDAIIGRNRLPEPVISLRGVQNVADTPFGGVPKVGDEAFDPAYGSTSIDPKIAAGFAGDGKDAAFITYHLPQGTPALYVPRITPLEDATGQQEKELLLPRGQTLRVVGIDKYQGKPNIHVELADHPLSHPADAAGYRADVGITPFRAGTEITDQNTLAAVLKEYPGSGIEYQEEVRRLGAELRPDALSVKILLTHVPATDAARAAFWDVVRYADLRGKQLDLYDGNFAAMVGPKALEAAGFKETPEEFLWSRAPDAAKLGKSFNVGGDDPIGFYNSDKYVAFLNDMRAAADHYHVAVDGLDRAEGLWEGETEPSLALHVHDGEVGVRAFAADLGKAYEQDGVLLFAPSGYPKFADMLVTLTAFPDRERVLAAMKAEGIDGGRILPDGRLQVIGTGSEFAAKVIKLSESLGVNYEVDFGRFEMLERDAGAYDRALRAASERSAGPPDPSSSLPGDRTLSLSQDELLDSDSVNAVFRVQHEGQDFIVKPEPAEPPLMRKNITPGNDAGRERAAYVLSRFWNDLDPDFSVRLPATRVSDVFVPEGIGTADQWGEMGTELASGWQRATISEFVRGEDARDLYDPGWADVIDPLDVRNGGLFDAVIGNTDRHAGNFKIDMTDGRTWLIDHGLAFPEDNERPIFNANLIRQAERTWTVALEPEELAFLERFRALRPQIDAELEKEKLLDADSLRALWERVDYMIEVGGRLPPGTDPLDEIPDR